MARGWRGRSSGAGPARALAGHRLDSSALSVAASRNSLAIAAPGNAVLTWGFNDSRGGGDSWHVRGGHAASIPDSGQLGRHATTAGSGPGAVVGPLASEGALSVASGRYHALAIGLQSRAVYSWGLNDQGQLGRTAFAGRAADRTCERGSRCRDGMPTPVGRGLSTLMPLPPAHAVVAGRYFSVAITRDGRAYAWGRCACGRAERSTVSLVEEEAGGGARRGAARRGRADSLRGSAQPYLLSGGGLEKQRLVSAAAGYAHLLLLTASGDVYSCESGDDGYGGRLRAATPLDEHGQLGRPGPPLVPLRVPRAHFGDAPTVQLAAGRCASVALDAKGRVYTWGCAQASGHPPPDDVRAPRVLEALRWRRIGAIAAGEYHTLATLVDGSALLTWGTGAGSQGTPVEVLGLPTGPGSVQAVAAGYQHSLAIARCV